MAAMPTCMARVLRVDALRNLWVVAAVLAALVAGVVIGGSSADATSYGSEELQFLRLINEYRENNGVEPLILSDTLAVAAERHSEDMGRYGFFAHYTTASSYYPAGSNPFDRMAAEGYDYRTFWGENLAAGYDTAEESFRAWRDSPHHNAAMLDGDYRVVGIARVQVPGSKYTWYWTTDFGGLRDPSSHAPGTQSKRVVDRGGIENGLMDGRVAWKQTARDGADLILEDGYARLGGYNSGEDDLRQKLRIGPEAELSYSLRITTDERRHPFDRLVVRLTDARGRQLAILRRYTDADAGGWRRQTVDLSRFAGRTVYLSYFARTDPTLLTTFYIDRVALKTGTRTGSPP